MCLGAVNIGKCFCLRASDLDFQMTFKATGKASMREGGWIGGDEQKLHLGPAAAYNNIPPISAQGSRAVTWELQGARALPLVLSPCHVHF